jgi:tetratricopeptide (TPR) repeat protein
VAGSTSPTSFVVAWQAEKYGCFVGSDAWAPVRQRFERELERERPGVQLEELRRRYSELRQVGAHLLPWTDASTSACCALRLDRDEPALFALVQTSRGVVPVVGSEDQIDARLGGARAAAAIYRPATDEELAPPQRPPSDVRVTPAAQRAHARISERRARAPEALGRLSLGEVIWVANALRAGRDTVLAFDVAKLALQRERSPSTLNLMGGVLRELGLLDESAAVFRESIDACPSAGANPYARVGVAATYRRQGRWDDAYDEVKRALRHYPTERHISELYDALQRDRSGRAAPRREAV